MLRLMNPAELYQQTGATASDVWRDYFVFTTSRNPWDRAASGYDYLLSRWHSHNGSCSHPTFEQFAADPTVLGKTARLFSCDKEAYPNYGGLEARRKGVGVGGGEGETGRGSIGGECSVLTLPVAAHHRFPPSIDWLDWKS